MRVWAEVFDASNARLGEAYALTSASVERALDAGGSIELQFPASATATVNLLTSERRVRIHIEQDGKARVLGSGVIRELTVEDREAEATISASGPDALDDLTRKSVLLHRSYTAQKIESIAANLLGLVPGWSVLAEAGLPTLTATFEGSSVLKALIRMCEETGLHLRMGNDRSTIEMGAFGTDNGVVALKPGSVPNELSEADGLLLIHEISRKTNSKDVVNWIIPLGADDGTGTNTLLTLKNSSHAVASLIGPDGNPIYYLRDSESIASYGQIERVVTFSQITDPDALYEASTAWLERNRQPLVTYTLSAKKCRTEIRPGDRIRVMYKGIIETETSFNAEPIFIYLDVNETFWVIKATEHISDEGMTLELDVATVPRYEIDSTEIIVGALEAMNVRVVKVNQNTGYIQIEEQQASGTSAGTFTSGDWRTRTLNIIVVNENGHASLGGNQITLAAGTYKYRALAPAFSVDSHQLRFRSVSAGSTVDDLGPNTAASAASVVETYAEVSGQFTIEETTVFELQHRCFTTKTVNGLGTANGWGTEVYASIVFEKTS